jgi:hypothetical protein
MSPTDDECFRFKYPPCAEFSLRGARGQERIETVSVLLGEVATQPVARSVASAASRSSTKEAGRKGGGRSWGGRNDKIA